MFSYPGSTAPRLNMATDASFARIRWMESPISFVMESSWITMNDFHVNVFWCLKVFKMSTDTISVLSTWDLQEAEQYQCQDQLLGWVHWALAHLFCTQCQSDQCARYHAWSPSWRGSESWHSQVRWGQQSGLETFYFFQIKQNAFLCLSIPAP